MSLGMGLGLEMSLGMRLVSAIQTNEVWLIKLFAQPTSFATSLWVGQTQESLCSQFPYFQFCWIAERLCLNLSGIVTFPSLFATPHPLGKVPWASSTRLANSPHNDLLMDTSSGSLLVVPKRQRAVKTATNTTKTASNIQATAIFFQTKSQVTPLARFFFLHKSRD